MLLAVASFSIYGLLPAWISYRLHASAPEEADLPSEFSDQLRDLVAQAQLRQMPLLVWNPGRQQ